MEDTYVLVSRELWGMTYYGSSRDLVKANDIVSKDMDNVNKTDVFGGNNETNISY